MTKEELLGILNDKQEIWSADFGGVEKLKPVAGLFNKDGTVRIVTDGEPSDFPSSQSAYAQNYGLHQLFKTREEAVQGLLLADKNDATYLGRHWFGSSSPCWFCRVKALVLRFLRRWF